MDKMRCDEHEYLGKLRLLLDEAAEEILRELGADKEALLKARREMWEKGSHFLYTFDDIAELSELNFQVGRNSGIYLSSKKAYDGLMLLKKSAYFGRFDFREEGEEEYEKFYIGRLSFMPEADYRIYDWRAPVSSIYYEYGTGAASYQGPEKVFHGDVNLKRQYKIKDGEIEYMFDTETTVHDELLAQLLSENTSNSLKVIISSIQKEQNAAIRSYGDRYLLIYGLAGSGKTSVGLHRLAYLLYRNRERMSSDNVLVLSHNNIFRTYIANILPELGEDNANISVFKDIYKCYLPEGYITEDYYEQAEKLRGDIKRQRELEIKCSQDFLDFMTAYFESFDYSFEDIVFESRTIVESKALYSIAEKSYAVSISKALGLIEDRCNYYFREHKKEIKRLINDRQEDFMLESEINLLYRRYTQAFIAAQKDRVRSLNRTDPLLMLKDILYKYLKTRGYDMAVCEDTFCRIENKSLYYEDAVLLLLCSQLTGLIQPENNILHVLIDEAQDLSAPQLYFLKNLYPRAFFTILADINQNINPLTGINSYEALGRVFGRELKGMQLYRSYRSSGPINALAFRLLGCENSGSVYYDRKGEKPRYIVADKYSEIIVEILKGAKGSVGIITADTASALNLYQDIKDKAEVQLISDPTVKIEKPVCILPLILAKGLEFDTAVAIDCMPADSGRAGGRNIAYLAGTRALHSLYYVNKYPLPEAYEDCRELMEFE
jgi:DNA helicase-2/ATP-dependent DNA helicase PcrA